VQLSQHNNVNALTLPSFAVTIAKKETLATSTSKTACVNLVVPCIKEMMKVSWKENTVHDRRYTGTINAMRSPERIAYLEVERTVTLCLNGIEARSALDVGTGSGVFAEAFAVHGLTVTGLDANAEALKTARRYVPQGVFQQAVAEAMPYPDRSFDVVFMGTVLHEVDDAREALAEARRVAGIRVAVLEWPYREESFGPPLAHRLTPEAITVLAQEVKFSRVEAVSLTHMMLYLMCI
jgi:SAM-dependent methyltransferase